MRWYIHAEIRRRIEATHQAAPTQRRKDAILKKLARVQNGIEKLLDAYQDGLLTLPELRKRVPELRKRQAALTSELQSLETSTVDQQLYFQLATTLEDFLARLRNSADTLNVIDRQRILRLVVKEVLVGRETLWIRHSIPVQRQDPTPPSPGETTTRQVIFCVSGVIGPPCGVPSLVSTTTPLTITPARR